MNEIPHINGGRIHNSRLILPTVDALVSVGAKIHFEYPVRQGRSLGFIDATARLDTLHLGIEGETKPDRVPKDLWKCEAARIDWLIIPTPTRGAARAITRMLQRMRKSYGPPKVSVCCQPVGVIVARILQLRPRATAETFAALFRPITQHFNQPVSAFVGDSPITQPKEVA